MPTTIRKVLIPSFGGPSVIQVVEDQLEDPSKDHVQIKVIYSGFSGSDINMRMGRYPMQKKAPLTPGYCLVGRVHQNGPGSSVFQTGDLVVALTKYDSEATYANVAEKYLIKIPEDVDLKAACALILDWNTAYGMVMRAAKVSNGHKVFVHGMSGAVGYAVMQLCQLQGATVYGTASERNHAAIKELGGIPFAYSNKEWIEEMKKIGGVQAIFDPLGYESWDESYSILSMDVISILIGYGGNQGTFNESGNTGGIAWSMSMAKLFAKNVMPCKRSTKFYYIDRDQKTFVPEFQELLKLLQAGEITVQYKRIIPSLDEVQTAHEEWNRMQGMGSVLVKIE